jgi:4-hydroxythreonine-4-phosphate dehydrogenase
MRLPVIAITPGEPAGIGPDLCVLQEPARDACFVYVGDRAMLEARAAQLNRQFVAAPWRGRTDATPGNYVLSLTAPRAITPGRPESGNADYLVETLRAAVDGCLSGEFDALVTAPVSKALINEGGIPFTGHTEFLGQQCRAQPVMMLACPDLRVALVTTHVPLADVSRHITRERLRGVLTILHRDLHTKFRLEDPTIAVCGLNPHAGESGHLGREEIETIEPVLTELKRQGMRLRGPLPADTLFVRKNLEGVDAVVAMYHDQGLPVIKHHDFARTVNVTLGLPFPRTSPDHGTALDLAGTGRADPTSFRAAVALARELCV